MNIFIIDGILAVDLYLNMYNIFKCFPKYMYNINYVIHTFGNIFDVYVMDKSFML